MAPQKTAAESDKDDAMQEMKETLKQAKHKKKGHHI